MFFFLPFSFLGGILTKITDDIADENKSEKKILGYVISLLYGTIVGFLMISDPRFFVLILGIIIGNILYRRIDHLNHQLAFLPIALFIAYSSIPLGTNFLLAIVFAFGAFLDESLNQMADDKRKTSWFGSKLWAIGEYRLSLEILTLIVSIVLWDPAYILLLASFDAGYILSNKLISKKLA